MREPIRLRDDPRAATELRMLLRAVPRARSLDVITRQRMGRRLARFISLPLVLTLGLTMKTAAAALAVTAGAVSIGAVVVHELRVVRSLSTPLVTSSVKAPAPTARVIPSGKGSEPLAEIPIRSDRNVASAAFSDEDPPSHDGLAPAPRPAAVVASNEPNTKSKSIRDGLEREAAMLEMARRALSSSPAEALAIVQEHRAEFPRATLELERELIRLDALVRLGRHAEARQLAELLRQRGGLYAERVERLIQKLDGAEN